MADAIVLLSMLAVLALLGFGLQRYLRRCCAQHTILQSVLRGLFIGLACSLLITTLIILYNPVATYAERAQLQSYVVVIYVAGGMALAFFLALLGIAAVMTFRGGYRHQLLKNSAVFARRIDRALSHAAARRIKTQTVRADSVRRDDLTSAYIDYALIANGMNKGRYTLEPPDHPN